MNSQPPESLEFKRDQAYYFFFKADGARLKGNLDEAKLYLSKAREINSEVKDNFLEASILHGFGRYYQQIGELEKAIEVINESNSIWKQLSGKDSQVGHGNGLVTLGTIYSVLGKYEEAIKYQEEGIEILLRSGDETGLGIAHGSMGTTYSLMNEHKKAIDLFKYGLKISEKTGNKYEEAKMLVNIGLIYCEMEEFNESIKCCNRSARIFTEIGMKPAVAHSYAILTVCYSTLVHLDEALRYGEITIDICRDTKQYAIIQAAYGNMGEVYYRIAFMEFLRLKNVKKICESCIHYFKLAIEITDHISVGLTVDSNKTAFSNVYYCWHDKLVNPFIMLGRSKAALLFLDLGRAKILRQLVYRQVVDQVEVTGESSFKSSWMTIENGKEDEEVSKLIREIQLSESNATGLFYNFNDVEILTIWVLDANGCVTLKTTNPSDNFSEIRNELKYHIEKFLQKTSVRFPRGYSFIEPSKVTDSKDASADEFTSRELSSEENANKAASDDHEEAGIPESEYRSPPDAAFYDEMTEDSRSFLHRALIDPVKSLLKGITKLIIVPQNCIFFAPFSAFVDESGCLLSEKYQIQIIPSIHVLASSMQSSRSKRIGGSLFVGNPKVENVGLPPLLSAAEEVEDLASLLGATPLTGDMATKSKVMDRMSEASIIHIAAHGHEETGHIFLAPQPSKPNESGHPTSSFDTLTQSDVLECKLSARLVVLSCCHSAHGKLSSEGVLGIARAFLGAGAKSVLVTLWKVNDMFTKLFMKVFYEKIFEEKSACLALKETMNMFHKSGQYSSFLFWGAFEILGEDISFTKSEIEDIRRKNRQS